MIPKEPNYSTVNGDPDATLNKINQTDIGNYEILDKTVRSREEVNVQLGLVTSVGQDKAACVYGTDLRIKNPCKMGGLITLLFIENQPIVCVGPQCNKNIFVLLLMN